jgi:hypothetical protein
MVVDPTFTVYPTEIFVECNIDFIESVGRSIRATNFSYRAIQGMLNTCCVLQLLQLAGYIIRDRPYQAY